MSNSKKSRFKKILCSSALSLGFLASTFTGLHYNNQINVSAAENSGYIVEDITSSVFGSGYNFNVTTSDSPATNVTGWSSTALSDDSYNSSYIKKGVVNLQDASYFNSENWELSSQPSMSSNKEDPEDEGYYKNLMINAYDKAGRFGYESNNSISLEANSYYKISVLVYTHKETDADPRASIYLTNLLDEDDEDYSQTGFEYFSTLGAWEKYSYYIDTDEAKTVKLQLWLGSKSSNSQEGANAQGAVFFNKVSIQRYSEESYYETVSELNDSDNDNFNIISLSPEYSEPVENSSFEDVSKSWNQKIQSTSSASDQINQIVDVNTFTNVNNNLTVTTPLSNCSANNQNALFMYNKKDGYQAVESSEFTIKQHTYYALSFWAKSNCNTGDGATVMLVDNSEENAIESASLTLATTYTQDSNKYRNDWTKYTFYIYGAPTKDTQATIQIWLGTQDSTTSGYVFVDDFRIQVIDYDTYNSNSSATNSTSFNFNSANDKYTIVNGEFNITKNDNTENIYPAVPSDWEKIGNTNTNTFSGIVNTSEEVFNANIDKFSQGILSPTRPTNLPYTDTDNNNVLMIGSSIETNTQTYKSSSFTLTEDSYYTISFYVMTDYVKNNVNTNYGARVTIASDTKTIFDLYNIKFDDNNWHKIEVKIKTGTNSENATISLSFNNLSGYVFFDKIELKSISETIYNSSNFDTAEETYKINLTYEKFDNNTYGKNPTSLGIEEPTSWNFVLDEEEVGVYSGIISSTNSLIDNTPPSLSGNTNYLYISALHNGYYYYTSNDEFTFESEKFYKISVNILTNNIVRDYSEDDENVGASIILGGSTEILMKNITTDGVWKTYTIYASFTEALTSNIILALGYTDELCMGEVLFDNLVITTLESDAYESEIAEATVGTYAEFTNYTEPEDEEDEETTPWENTFNWLILPSLITGLAIIISVIGFYIKKINFNRKPKVKTNYDRRKTLDKDIDRREKIALRKQIIEELRAELATIDQEIADFNIIAEEKLEEVKAQIVAEQEELKKQQLELEIRKKEATAEREKQLKESAEFVSNTKAEKEFNNYIAKLDRQEMLLQKKISDKEFKLATAKEINNEKLERYTARQEYIRLQIAKIEAEIEEIAKQEEEMWAEYRAAKADAKLRKTAYKAQLKAEKESKKSSSKSTTAKTSTKQTSTKTKKSEEKVDTESDNKVEVKEEVNIDSQDSTDTKSE